MSDIAESIIQFVQAQEHWAAPVVFVLAFCESFAFISLIVPATVVLFAIAGLLGAAGIAFWPVFGAAAAGAFVGDWLSFELALHFRGRLASVWPISRHPEILQKGFYLFARWGILIVFIGRFFGPLRAAVPLVAGTAGMARGKFQFANAVSAIAWAAVILSPGIIGLRW